MFAHLKLFMKKNTINAAIILTFFSVFGHAYSNIPNKRDSGIDGSLNMVEHNLNIDNSKSVGNLITKIKSDNMFWADTIENAKKDKKKRKRYKAQITLLDKSDIIKGYLYEVNDSSIVVSSTSELLTKEYAASMNNAIDIANISKIKLRRKGSIGKGYLIGTSVGIATGIILGASEGEGDGFTVFAAAGTLGIVGSVIGTTVGIISGSTKFNIGGNQNTFLRYQQKLKTMSLVEE